MHILVTGGLGFQGTNLCESLIKCGHHVDVFNTHSHEAVKNGKQANFYSCIWGSITDPVSVDKAVRDHDLVFNLAGNIHVDESLLDPRAYYETNVYGTLNVVEACRKHQVKLIHVSTCEVYGGSTTVLTEESPMKPRSPYAASKAGGDSLVYAHAVSYGMEVKIVRPANVFGRFQRGGSRGALIPRFVDRALAGESLPIYGTGQQTRSYIYIKDLVKAYMFLLNLPDTKGFPQVYNVSSGAEVSVLEIAHHILEFTDDCSCLEILSGRPGEVSSFYLDSARLRKLGFSCDYSFADALSEYVEIRKGESK